MPGHRAEAQNGIQEKSGFDVATPWPGALTAIYRASPEESQAFLLWTQVY